MTQDEIREYLEQLKEKSYTVSTIKQHRYVIRQFKELGFSKLTILDYQRKVQIHKIKTQHRYLTILKKLLHLYHPELEKYVTIPKLQRSIPKNIPDKITVKETLQRPDITTFKGVRDRVILEILYSTGIRRMELIQLKLEDIDLTKGVLRVNQGKGKKDRLLPIAKQSIQWIEKYIKKVRKQLNPRCNYLFLSRSGHQMNIGTPGKIIRKYSKHSPHKYRHAYATHLLQNGMKETSLQQLLGHSQVSTTQVYTQVTLSELKQSYAQYHKRESFRDVVR